MEAAVTLKKRGHDVEIWEKNAYIGGALFLASVTPGKSKLKWLLEYYDYMVKKLGIEVKFGKAATKREIERFNPDAVVFAHGAKCLVPPIKGIDLPNVITFRNVLNNKVMISGKKVVVGGGGLVGCETALYLAKMDNKVTIAEMLPEIARDMEHLSKQYLMREIKESGIEVMVNATVKEIKDGSVIVGSGKEIPADYFVVAFGGKSEHALYESVRKEYESYLIGDAVKARKIIDAVREGYSIGNLI